MHGFDLGQEVAELAVVDFDAIVEVEFVLRMGTDYTVDNVPEREVVLEYGGKIAITGDPKTRSSSKIIAQLASQTGPQSKKE